MTTAPLTNAQRAANYRRQGPRKPTPRQIRRWNHKANRWLKREC